MNLNELSSTDKYSLFRVGEAWRNRPGLTTMLITFAVEALLFVIGANSGRIFGGQLFLALVMILSLLISFAGISAAGIQFMDQANGRAVTPVLTAILGSPMVILRSFGLALILGVAFLAYLIFVSIILFVCKVPALGALVYVVALPVLTFLGALTFLGLTVAGLVSSAALWEGHSLSAALLQGWAVATQRPMQGFLNIVWLFLVTTLTALIVSGFVFFGFGVVGGLSAAILGSDMTSSMSGLMGSMMGGGFGERGSGGAMVFAGLLGGALVFAVVQALFMSMFTLGLALTYLKVTNGLDIAAAQLAMDSVIAKTKEKAQQAAAEAKRRAQDAQVATQQRLDQARIAQAARTDSVVNPILTCPKCKAVVSTVDAFCGSCGFKLI